MINSTALSILLAACLLLLLSASLFFFRDRSAHRRRLQDQASSLNQLQESLAATEQRFQYLFDNTTDSVYCYEFDPPLEANLAVADIISRSHDAVLIRCNRSYATSLGFDDINAPIGRRFCDLYGDKSMTERAALISAFVNNGYRLTRHESPTLACDGIQNAAVTNMVGHFNDGLLTSMWTVESNIVDLRVAQAELARRSKFQELVATVSSSLLNAPEDGCDAIVDNCLRLTCEFVDAGRAALLWASDDQKSIHALNIWSESIAKSPKEVSIGAVPCIARHILSNKVLRVDDVMSLPPEFARDRIFLQDYDVKSMLILPLSDADQVAGGMTFARLDRGNGWSDQDIQDLSVVSELFANYLIRLKSRNELSEALTNVQKASEKLKAENIYLKDEIKLTNQFDAIVGESYAIRRCLQLVEQVAATEAPVLVLGETGTGKELIARAIHDLSSRSGQPLVKVNCAALPGNLIESEFFGHEKGAFTGADSTKLGRFESASGSTLFLDEFGEIPLELQAKLLRVLQEGEFERIGGRGTIKVDVRIIAATNRDLGAAVKAGEFRSDLYYRVNTFPIALPPLRSRGGDIDLLARHFVDVHASRLNSETKDLSVEMMQQIRDYHWPGNVRELEGIIQRALIASDSPILNLAEPLSIRPEKGESPRIIGSTIDGLKLVEREEIVSALDRTRWRISGEYGAATLLGIPPSTLRSKMKRLGISKPH